MVYLNLELTKASDILGSENGVNDRVCMILYDTENAVSNEIGISDEKHIRNGPCLVLTMASMVEIRPGAIEMHQCVFWDRWCSGGCEQNGNCKRRINTGWAAPAGCDDL